MHEYGKNLGSVVEVVLMTTQDDVKNTPPSAPHGLCLHLKFVEVLRPCRSPRHVAIWLRSHFRRGPLIIDIRKVRVRITAIVRRTSLRLVTTIEQPSS